MAAHVKSTADLAFNISLVAYDYNYPNRLVNQHLVVKKASKKEVIATFLKGHDVSVPKIEPSQAELNGGVNSNNAIWIGMRPGAAGDYVKRSSSGQAKGASVAKNKGYKSIPTDASALRVVAPLGKLNANYYSLVNQDEDRLCTGYLSPIEEVFFFPEFRDDEVRTACRVKQRVTWPKKYDKLNFQINPKRSFRLEISTLVTSYQLSGDYSLLKTAMYMIDDVSGDESSGLVHGNVWMERLITTTEPLELHECGEFVTQLQVWAPDIVAFEVKAEEVKRMSEGMCEAGIVLEYRLLRAFLVLFITSLRQTKGGSLKDIALAARKLATLSLGPAPKCAVRSSDGFGAFLNEDITSIKDIESLVRHSIKALKDSQGESLLAPAPSLPQIWEKYGNAPDIDSAKLYASHIHRFNVQALGQQREPVPTELEKRRRRSEALLKALIENDGAESEE